MLEKNVNHTAIKLLLICCLLRCPSLYPHYDFSHTGKDSYGDSNFTLEIFRVFFPLIMLPLGNCLHGVEFIDYNNAH